MLFPQKVGQPVRSARKVRLQYSSGGVRWVFSAGVILHVGGNLLLPSALASRDHQLPALVALLAHLPAGLLPHNLEGGGAQAQALQPGEPREGTSQELHAAHHSGQTTGLRATRKYLHQEIRRYY